MEEPKVKISEKEISDRAGQSRNGKVSRADKTA
jgi:hypothetical protein